MKIITRTDSLIAAVKKKTNNSAISDKTISKIKNIAQQTIFITSAYEENSLKHAALARINAKPPKNRIIIGLVKGLEAIRNLLEPGEIKNNFLREVLGELEYKCNVLLKYHVESIESNRDISAQTFHLQSLYGMTRTPNKITELEALSKIFYADISRQYTAGIKTEHHK